MNAGEEGHARPGWKTSRRGQDSPWKSQSECRRTGINGESTSPPWCSQPSDRGRLKNRTGQRQRWVRESKDGNGVSLASVFDRREFENIEYFIYQHRHNTVETVKSRIASTGQKGSKSTYNCPKR